jgi:hypothetical protein
MRFAKIHEWSDMDFKETDQNPENNPSYPPRQLRHRRIGLLRGTLIILMTTAGLAFFLAWYRALPQGMDCARMTQRVTTALETYRREHHKLPPILNVLNVRKGRYPIEHFDYWFGGIGGPELLPTGTLIAYCKVPHEAMFSDPWRSAIMMNDGQIIATRLSEKEFQKILKQQLPVEQYFELHFEPSTE